MEIRKVSDADTKSEICNSILRSLPLWFGIESAILDYVNDVRPMDTWAIFDGGSAVGFASINAHFPETAEVHVMGIRQEHHRRGLGRELLGVIEAELRERGVRFLTVKTLSASRPNKEYDQTREFYLRAGFTPLEEFKTLWGEHNPCLFLAKALRPGEEPCIPRRSV